MKRNIFLTVIILLSSMLVTSEVNAQFMRFGFGPRMGGGYYSRPYRQQKQQPAEKKDELPKFVPTVNISVGFGYPNLDKYLLPDLSTYGPGYIKGDYQQTGILTGAIDYQFSRFTSIGLMGAYGNTSVPYYLIGAGPTDPAIYNATLKGWSVMANLVNYFAPVDMAKVNGYLRLAAGVNVWDQSITDANGVKQNNIATSPTEFAYQVALGADFNLSQRAAIYVEGGYGKYILSGGLKLKF